MAMGHVILKEFYFDKRSAYFDDYARRYTDLPLLVMLKEHTLPDGRKVWCPTATCAPATSTASSARPTTPSGRRWPSTTERQGGAAQRLDRLPLGPEGRDEGKWNLEAKEARGGET
jgi:nitrate reductase / nitrite oxidoreductase, alpha subunit